MKAKINFLLILSVLLTFATCKDEEDDKQALTTNEAAEVVAVSMQGMNNYGIAGSAMLDASPDTRQKSTLDLCTFSNSYSTSFQMTGAQRSYNYNFNCTYGFHCNGTLIPNEFYLDFTSTGTYDGPFYSATGTTSGDWILTDFLQTTLTMNGTTTYNGTQTHKQTSRTIVANVQITYTNVGITPVSGQYVSGTATIRIYGTLGTGGTFDYSGSLEFNTSNDVKLTISNSVYTLDIETGQVSS